jgi:uncharacterized phage infection (PIP) family protein YhgE
MKTISGTKLRLLELIYFNADCDLPIHSAMYQAKQLFDWVYNGQSIPINEVSSKLDLINSKLDQVMTKQEKLDEIMGLLNTNTNRMAAVLTNIKEDYAKLLKDVQDGTVTDESLEAHKTSVNNLGTVITALEETAASVENPVSETPLPETPAEEQPGEEEEELPQ